MKLEFVSRAFLYIKIKIEPKRLFSVDDMGLRRERKDVPKIITATSTEQRTPSSYAFLKRPFLRCEVTRINRRDISLKIAC